MKIRCEVCGNLGQLQHLSMNYYRVKHYLGSIDGKLRFEYHKQSLGYIKGILENSDNTRKINPIDQKTIDPKLLNNSSFNEIGSRGSLAWPGRQTHNLENKERGLVRPMSRRRGLETQKRESRPRHHTYTFHIAVASAVSKYEEASVKYQILPDPQHPDSHRRLQETICATD